MLKSIYFSKLRKACLERSRKGVTLLELLIAIFIFSIVLIIISSSMVQGFVTGRLYSSATKEENTELNAVTALISQKMTGANTTAFTLTNKIYGFKVIGGNILAVASSSPTPQCTYFERKTADQALYMYQDTCTVIPADINTNSTGWSKVTTGITKITSFDLSNNYNYVVGSQIAPWITVKITGEDTNTKAVVTLEQTYSLNYPYSWLN